jgi:hypothetical protein
MGDHDCREIAPHIDARSGATTQTQEGRLAQCRTCPLRARKRHLSTSANQPAGPRLMDGEPSMAPGQPTSPWWSPSPTCRAAAAVRGEHWPSPPGGGRHRRYRKPTAPALPQCFGSEHEITDVVLIALLFAHPRRAAARRNDGDAKGDCRIQSRRLDGAKFGFLRVGF